MKHSACLRRVKARAPIISVAVSQLAASAAGVALFVAVCAALVALASPVAEAMTIEKVVSPGGIEAWLVRDKAVPVIAVEFAIAGSADQDPALKRFVVPCTSKARLAICVNCTCATVPVRWMPILQLLGQNGGAERGHSTSGGERGHP